MKGVTFGLAKAIFTYLVAQRKEITTIIVGQHGKNILKDGMLDFINSLAAYNATVDGYNPGQLNIKKIDPLPSEMRN